MSLIVLEVKDNFEFDKIVIAVAISIFAVIFSGALGGFFYRTDKIVEKKGYIVEITEIADSGGAPKTLPDIIDIGAILAQADAALGEKIFNKCAVCHTINKGEANKVGPNLWSIVGSKVSHSADFAYSEAMKKLGSEGRVWGFEELYRYLFSPKAYVPGTKMAFAGIKDDKDRANLIAYLRSKADSPLPIPKPKG